jgi:hypothetical protein
MTISWPEDLPLGIKYGATTEVGKGSKITTQMDYGNKLRRRRFTRVPFYQNVTVCFNDAEYEQFVSFYSYVLRDGVVSFNAPVLVGIDIEVKRCTIDSDSLIIEHGDYNWHTVSMILEIYDLFGNEFQGGYEYLIGLYGEEFVSDEICDPIQQVVNVLYPQVMEDF